MKIADISLHTIPGTLLRMERLGVLLIGPSGTGKSETALALLKDGHQLVADDLVQCMMRGGFVLGVAPTALAGKLHIRDLGLLAIGDIVGPEALCQRSRIDLVIQLEPAEAEVLAEDLFLPNQQTYEILGKKLPILCLQHTRGRPLPLLVSTAVKRMHSQRIRMGKIAS